MEEIVEKTPFIEQANIPVYRSVTIMVDGVVEAFKKTDEDVTYFFGVSKGESIIKRIVGDSEVYDMLIRAVNNRTRERNYFRLYSDLLSSAITEEEFDKEIEEHEDEYVVESNVIPNKQVIEQALHLASKIKDVETSEDISSLFSFNPDKTDDYIRQLELQQ